MKSEYRLLIGGMETPGAEIKPVINPYSGEIVAEVHRANRLQIISAIETAFRGFDQMKKLVSYQREEILHKVSRLIQERSEELALCIALEAGKPIKDARIEVERGATTFSLAAGEAIRLNGEILPLDINRLAGDRLGLIARFPLGVITAISPFNFPLNLVAHKVAPAIAVGNSVVLKPSSSTPITALMLGEILLEAGLPPEAISVVPCSPKNAEPLLSHPLVKMVTFTGSPEVGWGMKSRCGKARICLELGGNAAAIVEPDADIDHAINRCAIGGYSYSGQICISLQRLYLHESIADKFIAEFVEKVRSLIVGNPLLETTQVGPMIEEASAMKIEVWVDQAVKGGSHLLCGGKRDGNFYEPTILMDVPEDQPISNQEAFAPVTVIYRYSDFEVAIRAVNRSRYGLQAALFTQDMRKILQAFNRIEVGGLIVNDVPTFRADNYPYGGVKSSGLGREGVRYAMEEMTEMKALVLMNQR
jgi:acyl-CoA reductase-like NAD-dependent aldehyde dehydrogenase